MNWYLIRNTITREWWSNADGWGNHTTATPFSSEQKEELNLPLDGEWLPLVSERGLKS